MYLLIFVSGNLYHWRSRNIGSQERLLWSTFFDITSLQLYIPVIEMYEFVEGTFLYVFFLIARLLRTNLQGTKPKYKIKQDLSYINYSEFNFWIIMFYYCTMFEVLADIHRIFGSKTKERIYNFLKYAICFLCFISLSLLENAVYWCILFL